ncbi:peptidoglycan DD-metalloendopeptidase family protein [Brachybacterium sp. Marseille-Q2903]|uniref:Peptidoglycan DD-metalloendopeptidase family protein n=1 Tax=Brachybacterium epidermidis TaxID=2781983 RepID=A0ABR9VY02_9MICO|nr:peptidoglycan DD-metalloendopeptidase family protein [Brachybacterium epidermidis]
MANHRAHGRALVCARSGGGTHRDSAVRAGVVKSGVLGALATATIAAPLAATAADVTEAAPADQPAASPVVEAPVEPVQPVALPVAEASLPAAEGAEVRTEETTATRAQERTSPAEGSTASADDPAAPVEDEATLAENEAVTGIKVTVPEPEPEPAAVDESGQALPQSSGGYVRPVGGPITSGYGYRTHPVLGYSKMHDGVDFGASCGTPVHSAQSGTVIAVEYNGASGKRVKVDHGNGVITGYYHLQSYGTSVGATVEAGEVIGYVGSTGRSTGCHLHFAKMDEAGTYSNPMSLLR